MSAGAMRNDGNLSSLNRQAIKSTESAHNNVLSAKEISTFSSFKSPAFNDAQSFIEQHYPAAQPTDEKGVKTTTSHQRHTYRTPI